MSKVRINTFTTSGVVVKRPEGKTDEEVRQALTRKGVARGATGLALAGAAVPLLAYNGIEPGPAEMIARSLGAIASAATVTQVGQMVKALEVRKHFAGKAPEADAGQDDVSELE